nr:immunoglobulin light chain junction region [Macaca mulatta]MOV78381.1 immunoglobulin light chain junction region [Macaca mulatta]MOV81208.1 immunoglobulin light chain junction region [Macaca mulatta]MOV81232.1 immunoglobulin light chain junction region [Macaca mulatta]MOV82268.1 immunoglobulin light chain junction region [Macaca mulatta]
SMHDSGGPTTF